MQEYRDKTVWTEEALEELAQVWEAEVRHDL